MSQSGILDALRNEERSLKSQLVAIQRAIEAIEGNVPPAVGRGRKKAAKAVGSQKRTMSDEQRRAVADRMRNYWASRRERSLTYLRARAGSIPPYAPTRASYTREVDWARPGRRGRRRVNPRACGAELAPWACVHHLEGVSPLWRGPR